MDKRKLKREARSLAVAVGAALLLRAFVVEAYSIPSGSMIPTLQVGDRIFVEKLSYRLRAPRRGEIVVFENPHQAGDTPLIKRIVAVGGDTVEVRGQQVYVNGAAVERRAVTENGGDCLQWDVDEPSGQWFEEECRAFQEQLGAHRFTTLTDGSDGKVWPAIRVPDGNLFVLGDNRDRSSDSRYWGLVPVAHVKGRAVIVWWSSGSPAGIRWGHFFDRL